MQLGDQSRDEHDQQSWMYASLDSFDNALTDLITSVETDALDQLPAGDKVAVWQGRGYRRRGGSLWSSALGRHPEHRAAAVRRSAPRRGPKSTPHRTSSQWPLLVHLDA